jgi:hypothetical protein
MSVDETVPTPRIDGVARRRSRPMIILPLGLPREYG